ncbi:hypothetical protein AVEN_56910-1 [Araneus ventricosus]|uniref:Uncharacterized protein n=1 Tax=Araneus ventricosus TaxID=182803 RepID=A0A4Y2ETG3_ARAVE|nr:hypothetical protein AVEN_56910-1 [Araneus ventricosus]
MNILNTTTVVLKTDVFSRLFSNEDDVTIKTISPLRRVVRISAERRILRRILHNDELWDTKMLPGILIAKDERPDPGQEDRLWVTSRSRVPVDGAAIASDVRESSCREQ